MGTIFLTQENMDFLLLFFSIAMTIQSILLAVYCELVQIFNEIASLMKFKKLLKP